MVCSNKCYYCTTFSDTLCSTDFSSTGILDTFVSTNLAAGYTCVTAYPSHSEELCGSSHNQNAIQQTLEGKGYSCKSQ